MPKMIQIRNVPDETHRVLKARAAVAGMSLSDYLKQHLERLAAQDTWAEIDARVQARGPSGLRSETILAALREARGD